MLLELKKSYETNYVLTNLVALQNQFLSDRALVEDSVYVDTLAYQESQQLLSYEVAEDVAQIKANTSIQINLQVANNSTQDDIKTKITTISTTLDSVQTELVDIGVVMDTIEASLAVVEGDVTAIAAGVADMVVVLDELDPILTAGVPLIATSTASSAALAATFEAQWALFYSAAVGTGIVPPGSGLNVELVSLGHSAPTDFEALNLKTTVQNDTQHPVPISGTVTANGILFPTVQTVKVLSSPADPVITKVLTEPSNPLYTNVTNTYLDPVPVQAPQALPVSLDPAAVLKVAEQNTVPINLKQMAGTDIGSVLPVRLSQPTTSPVPVTLYQPGSGSQPVSAAAPLSTANTKLDSIVQVGASGGSTFINAVTGAVRAGSQFGQFAGFVGGTNHEPVQCVVLPEGNSTTFHTIPIQ